MDNFLETKNGKLVLDKKIGSGCVRDCYSIKNKEELCVKISKTNLSFLRKLQSMLFRNQINIEEYKIYTNLPNEIKMYFNPVLEAEKKYVLTNIPQNYDGSYSKSVKDSWPLSNEKFWKEVEKIYYYLDKYKIWFLDVFNGNNMFVKKQSETDWIPIIIDYKRIGWKSFPGQIHLLLKSEREKKFKRRYERFVNKYKIK